MLLVLWGVVLGGSFAHRQMQRRAAAVAAEPVTTVQRGDDRPVRVYSGLVYTDTIGIEPNFRVAARETLEFASGWYELKDVEVSIFHAGEVAYGLVASDARYNPQLREAYVHGNAQLSLSKGIALRADGFELRGAERSFTSRGPVTFAAAGWGGVAGAVSGNTAENTVELTDNVTASWRGKDDGSVVVLAPRLAYQRQRAMVTLPQGVTLLYGQLQLTAAAAEMRMRGAEGPPETVQFGGGVAVDARFGDGSTVEVRGESLQLRLGEGGELELTVQPEERTGWVTARWTGKDGAVRTVTAWRLVGAGSATSGPQWLEGQGMVCVAESEPARAALRRLSADALRVDFGQGRPESATAWGNVRLESGAQWGEGDRLALTLTPRRSVLLPATDGRVRFGSPSLEARANRLESDPEGGLAAEGAVDGTLAQGRVFGGQAGPIQFAAARAISPPNGETLTLEGDARLWQGERLVRADRLDYRAADETVVARGNVVTVGPTRQQTSGGEESIVRIAARALTYEASTLTAVFEGDVRLADDRTDLTAQRVTGTFAPGGELILAIVEGGITLRERASGRMVAGQRARLIPQREEVEVWGEPVLIQEPNGNQMKAAHVVWRRREGVLAVEGGPESRSETLYRADQPLPTPRSAHRPAGRKPSIQ